MDYEAIAAELSEPKYSTFRDDPATCIDIMQAEETEIYNAFPTARWSEDLQQRGTPQGVYKQNLITNKESVQTLADGRSLGAVCTDILDTIDGNTLSEIVDYTDDEIRTNMDATLEELISKGVLDLLIVGKMRSHGVTKTNKWVDLDEPTEGDIVYAWALVP